MNTVRAFPSPTVSLATCLWAVAPLAVQGRTQVTELVSQPQGYHVASWPSASRDGRWVAYRGYMPDPVVDPTVHIFVRDRLSDTTFDLTPLPPPPSGGAPSSPSISTDGQWVAFTRSLKVVHEGINYIYPQILKEAATGGAFEVVSRSSSGVPANYPCGEPSFSNDGRYVAFQSRASNLAGELKVNQSGDNDIFLRDTLTGTTVLISVSAAGGTTGDGSSSHANLSQDGRQVAFESVSTDLVPGGTNGRVHIFVRDLHRGLTVLISAPGGVQANHHSHEPVLSADGRFVVYESLASNLVPGDTNADADVFLCDRDPDGDGLYDEGDSVTTRVSLGQGGAQGNNYSGNPWLSGDGRIVLFQSHADNLVPGDTNLVMDVFARDLWTLETQRASVDDNLAQGNALSGNSSPHSLTLSADGRIALFMSDATNLAAGDSNGVTDVFSRELGIALPHIYCTAKVNSQGCTPAIGFVGVLPSLSDPQPFLITASSVINNKFGLLLYGFGAQAAPFQGGTLCVAPQIRRTGLQSSGGNPPPNDCSGTFALDFNAYLQSGADAELTAYRTVFAQYWYRDPQSGGGFPTGLTDALRTSIAP